MTPLHVAKLNIWIWILFNFGRMWIKLGGVLKYHMFIASIIQFLFNFFFKYNVQLKIPLSAHSLFYLMRRCCWPCFDLIDGIKRDQNVHSRAPPAERYLHTDKQHYFDHVSSVSIGPTSGCWRKINLSYYPVALSGLRVIFSSRSCSKKKKKTVGPNYRKR